MKRKISTVDDLVEALGGRPEAAKVLEAGGANVVWNWQGRGKIPTRLYLRHKEILDGRKIIAPSSIWFEGVPS